MAGFVVVVVEIDPCLGRASLDCVYSHAMVGFIPVSWRGMVWGSFVGDDVVTVFVHFHVVFDAALSAPAVACLSQTVLVCPLMFHSYLRLSI
ncbi:hypothetical protein Tco_0384873 [Tanacetum coccineum]